MHLPHTHTLCAATGVMVNASAQLQDGSLCVETPSFANGVRPALATCSWGNKQAFTASGDTGAANTARQASYASWLSRNAQPMDTTPRLAESSRHDNARVSVRALQAPPTTASRWRTPGEAPTAWMCTAARQRRARALPCMGVMMATTSGEPGPWGHCVSMRQLHHREEGQSVAAMPTTQLLMLWLHQVCR